MSLCGVNSTSKPAVIRTLPCKTNFDIVLFVKDLRHVQPGLCDQIQEIQGIALSDFTSMSVQTDKIAHTKDTNKWHCNKMHTSLRPSDFFLTYFFPNFQGRRGSYDHWSDKAEYG